MVTAASMCLRTYTQSKCNRKNVRPSLGSQDPCFQAQLLCTLKCLSDMLPHCKACSAPMHMAEPSDLPGPSAPRDSGKHLQYAGRPHGGSRRHGEQRKWQPWGSLSTRTISSHPRQPKQSWGLKEALRAKACVPTVGTCPGHDSCHIPAGLGHQGGGKGGRGSRSSSLLSTVPGLGLGESSKSVSRQPPPL